MNSVYLWGNSLPLATFVASLILLFIAVRKKWPVEIPSTEPPDDPEKGILLTRQSSIRERIKIFVEKYRWELILGAGISAILLFALIFAPPRLNGEIAIRPHFPGRPFYNLHWVRDFLSTYYDKIWVWSSASLSLICLTLLAWAIMKRSGLGAQFVVLCSALNLAGVGQWLLHVPQHQATGKIFYFIAMYGFGVWAWAAHKRLVKDLERKPVTQATEVWLILGLLLLTSFNRLYALQAIPYGIEGDEAKWTSEAVNLGIRGVPDGSGEYHRDALPVSYYLQTPLHRLLGASLFAARLTVVLLSIVATLIFYWLLRQISVVPVAVIATYLLSISIFDISASRLANVESFVKIWPVLGLALLALAVRMRRWQVYGLSGLAIALGMLTYDTVWPLFVVVVVIAFIELARQGEKLHARMSSIAALITPTLLALPVLIPYLTSRLDYYEFGEKGLNQDTAVTLAQYFGNVLHTWFIAMNSDFLYNRHGPLLNALLLPLLVLGMVIAFSLIKKKISYWTLLWAGLVIFPVPILTNSPFGRIYYPALPAVYTLVALGLFFFWKETNRFFGVNLKPIIIAGTLVPLIWLPLANLFIYFNEVYDDDDRLMRREIAEFASQAADVDTIILLPATPGADTPLNNEYQMLELFMLKKIPSSELEAAYLYVAPEELMSGITSKANQYQKIEIIFDKDKTEALTKTLPLCFPRGTLTEGEFFNRFSLSGSEAKHINCSYVTLKIELEEDNKLNWKLSEGATQRLELHCDVHQADFSWFELEDLYMGNGWQTETEFAPGWNGKGFAMDNYGSGPLALGISPERLQSYYIWVRYYKRTTVESSAYLNIDNNQFQFADINEKELKSWIWERIGPVDIDIDSQISISHIHKDDPQSFMAIFMDSLVITPDIEFSPEANIWDSKSPKVFSFEQPQSNGIVLLDLPPDSYRCKVTVESEIPVVDLLGVTSPYVISNTIEFEIR